MLHRKLVFTVCLSCLTLPGFAKLIRADELPVESRSLELVQINNLIDQLDAREFSKRRQAFLALRAFGPLAVEPLKEAALKGNPEIISHAVELMEGWSLDADRRVFEPAADALIGFMNTSNGELVRRSEVAHLRHLRHRRRLAQAAINALGGVVNINAIGPNRESVSVTLGKDWRGGVDISAIDELGAIQQLTLASPILTDATLEQVGKFTSIQQLNLYNGLFTKVGFSKLADLRVRTVHVNSLAHTTDLGESLKFLATMSYLNLQSLDLTKTDMNPLKDLPLRNLTVNQCRLRDDGLVFLKNIATLQYAQIYDTKLSTENLTSLGQAPALANLNLRQVPLTKDNLVDFDGKSINMLSLYSTGIDADALASLGSLQSLTRLSLSETNLTDDALPGLKKLKNLKYLSLQNTKITADGGKELTEALKPCRVTLSPSRRK
jgi:hypothetical protein